MARESTQHKLDRVRSPRVHITYDVETGGAIELKELPFVVGVLGDFTGQPTEPLPKLKERKFVEVNPDNFDSVLEGMKPHLAFSVENKLSDEPDAAQSQGQPELQEHGRLRTRKRRAAGPASQATAGPPHSVSRICGAVCRATTNSKNCSSKRSAIRKSWIS